MSSVAKSSKKGAVSDAVHRHEHLSKEGLLERAFTFAFRGLVYAQIWEDPVVDMEALELQPDHHLVTIASGGCNAQSYLIADPKKITAVDLNPAHIALNKMKQQAALHLPDYDSFHQLFGLADQPGNVQLYYEHIRPHLDETSRAYWEHRGPNGHRRITAFKRGFYHYGLLGRLIAFVHWLAHRYKIDPTEILKARSMEEQREIFDRKFAPFFDKKLLRWMIDQPASLFGLGIPPAQYDLLKADDREGITGALRSRLRKLACDFPINENYFAWQAFGRGYGRTPDAPLPPYLQRQNWDVIQSRADRLEIRHQNMSEYLEQMPAQSMDRYILLDAQDWMTDAQLTRLWTAITRTAKPGARVLYRTAAMPDVVKGHIPDDIMAQWEYAPQEKLDDWVARDRSSVYGAMHLWTLKPHAA